MTIHSLTHRPLIESIELDELGFDEQSTGNTPGFDTNDSPTSDRVFRLREWGTHRMVLLRAPSGHHKATALQLSSRYQATSSGGLELTCEGHSWRLKDWVGVANLKQDGAPTREVTLAEGTEVTIAGRILIAESPRTVVLRAFCARLLGWSDERMGTVDQALRAIRLASSGRAILVIRGKGDMIPIAFAIHRRALGREAPFVVSDPRRGNTPETVRGPANCKKAMLAFHRVLGGTLCVRAGRLPQDFEDILKAYQEPGSGVRLLICAGSTVGEAFSMGAVPIDIPPLEARPGELERIIREYAVDAIELLHSPRSCLNQRDLEWVSGLPHPTIPKIEKALQRVVAIKTSRNISAAASRLGMAPVSLVRWLARRNMSKGGTLYVPQPGHF